MFKQNSILAMNLQLKTLQMLYLKQLIQQKYTKLLKKKTPFIKKIVCQLSMIVILSIL